MNPLLALGPIGMILVGVLSITFWKLKRKVGLKIFLAGGVVWAAAVAPKILMDYGLTPTLSRWAALAYGPAGMMAIVGVYVGLRTGFFECGFTYWAFSRSRLKEMSVDEATAFGIGFGAFEAILLGVPALVQILTFIFNPSLLNTLPPLEKQIMEAQLSLPTWVVPAPIVERFLTMFIHIFTALLVFMSVRQRKASFFLAAFFYKGFVDGLVPYIRTVLQPAISPTGIYMAEAVIAVIAAAAIIGIFPARRYLLKQPSTQES
ncbi:MAG: YhfC family glutamic-type intramembrane protease [Candidatus Hecatellaceae archaeon]